jgi:hypothetical protein
MEHLPPVTNPLVTQAQIPYLGRICRYDGGGFEDFPHRQGWKVSGSDTYHDSLVRANGREPTVREETAFLQAWLFFGLLVEVFKCVGIAANQDDFISHSKTPDAVSTVKLPIYLEKWLAYEENQTIECQREHLEHVLELLHTVGDMVDSLLSFPRLRYQNDEECMEKLIVAESIAILGDSLMNATKLIWQNLQEDLMRLEHFRVRKTLRFCEPATLSLKRLEHNGWCKSSRMMLHRLVDTTGLYYAGRLKKESATTAHVNCSAVECVELHINKDEYKPKHVTKNCQCPVISIDRDRVAGIIQEGKIPCVRIKLSNARMDSGCEVRQFHSSPCLISCQG